VFLGSASLVATGGMSSESKNVGLWDTLMPMKKAQIASFTCHDQVGLILGLKVPQVW